MFRTLAKPELRATSLVFSYSQSQATKKGDIFVVVPV